MKEQFEKPTMVAVGKIGSLSNEEIAALPDEELARYLKENGYYEAKRAALEAESRTVKM